MTTEPTNRAVALTYEQFRYSFANAVGEDEAKELYLGYSVPGAGEPLFQAAAANLLTIDRGWREVAETTLAFVKRVTASERKVA